MLPSLAKFCRGLVELRGAKVRMPGLNLRNLRKRDEAVGALQLYDVGTIRILAPQQSKTSLIVSVRHALLDHAVSPCRNLAPRRYGGSGSPPATSGGRSGKLI